MLFGSSIYKVQLLNAQNQKSIHQRALTKATKNVKNLEKQQSQSKQAAMNWFNGEYKRKFFADNMGVDLPDAEATAEDKNAYWAEYNRVSALFSAESANYSQYVENNDEINNEALLEAAKNEEENEQIEVDYWGKMEEFFQKFVEQAEKWFSSTLDLIFGGGRR